MMWLTSAPEVCSAPAIKSNMDVEADAVNEALSYDIVALSLVLSAFVMAGNAGTRPNGITWPTSTKLRPHELTCHGRAIVASG